MNWSQLSHYLLLLDTLLQLLVHRAMVVTNMPDEQFAFTLYHNSYYTATKHAVLLVVLMRIEIAPNLGLQLKQHPLDGFLWIGVEDGHSNQVLEEVTVGNVRYDVSVVTMSVEQPNYLGMALVVHKVVI
jgi:hypothetical protein